MTSVETRFRQLPCALGLILVALLAGCASMDKDECRSADWRTVGFEDGLRGYPASRIGDHRSACAKHQVAPDLAAYTEGRNRGLNEFCQPRNGYRAGLDGRRYGNVCPATHEAAFLDAYRYGHRIYDARRELRGAQQALQSATDSLSRTHKAIDDAKAELIRPDLPASRRLTLAQDLVRLVDERRDWEARVSDLNHRAHTLSADLHHLEARSPYRLH